MALYNRDDISVYTIKKMCYNFNIGDNNMLFFKNKNMQFQKQIKKISITFALLLFFPMAVFAATEWGAGIDSDGNVIVGIGSEGSGAGNIWGGSGGSWALANPYGLPQGSILGIFSNILFWLLAIFAILGVVGFLIAGIIYLISTGDDTMISRAKTAMTYSIVGIIVGLSGFLIMQAVRMLLSGGSASF
jgi:hypothetical protein